MGMGASGSARKWGTGAKRGAGALEDGDVVLPKWERAQVGTGALEDGASGKRAPSGKQGALEEGDVVLRAVVRRSGDGDDRPLVGQVNSAAQTRRAGERANKQTIRQMDKHASERTR